MRAELEDRVLGKFAAVLLMISLEHYVRQTFQNHTISMNKRKKITCRPFPVPQDSQFQKTHPQNESARNTGMKISLQISVQDLTENKAKTSGYKIFFFSFKNDSKKALSN